MPPIKVSIWEKLKPEVVTSKPIVLNELHFVIYTISNIHEYPELYEFPCF